MSYYPQEVRVLHETLRYFVISDNRQTRRNVVIRTLPTPPFHPGHSTTPNPYDTPQPQGHQLHDPFATPYGAPYNPLPPPNVSHPDPFDNPVRQDYLNPGFNAPPRPNSSNFSTYDDHDANNNDDLGDIPLLHRDSSFTPSVPGGYEASVHPDDEASNIRYGVIPQRVPRRYKTMKRVE